MRTRKVTPRLAAVLSSLALLGIASPAARAQDPVLDDDTKKALATLETDQRADAALAEKLVSSPAVKAIADGLVALTRKDPKAHATHEAAGALLGRVLAAHPEITPSLEALADLAEHDSTGCRKAGVALLRAVLKLKPTVTAALDARIDADLEARVEALFKQIEQLVKQNDMDELIPTFAELEEVMRTYGRSGRDAVQAKLKTWEGRLGDWAEIRAAVRLQLFMSEGNALLRTMVVSLRNERSAEGLAAFARVEKLAEEMRGDPRAEFATNASSILIRAQGLRDETLKLQKIAGLKLVVSAIVFDPRPDARSRTIVFFDGAARIYQENDLVRDHDNKASPGLKIVKIVEGSVTFQLDDTTFVRELKAP